jgi:hypothetical protein
MGDGHKKPWLIYAGWPDSGMPVTLTTRPQSGKLARTLIDWTGRPYMQQNRFPLGLVIGVALVLVAAVAFIGASVVRNATATEPTATAIPPTPEATSTATRVPTPTANPTAVPTLPETAPDFTLRGAKGVRITLSEQLAKGPVVLVFFTSGGG